MRDKLEASDEWNRVQRDQSLHDLINKMERICVIPTLKRAVPQSWGTSNGTFKTKKVGEITLSFTEYSLSKSVHLTPDIVEYDAGATAPLY